MCRNTASATFPRTIGPPIGLAFSALFSLLVFAQLAQAQCAGFCGLQSPAGCFCDEDCFDWGDCCPDVCDACPEVCVDPPPPPRPPVNNSCQGALPIIEGLTPFSTQNATTNGPLHHLHCTEGNNPFIFTDIYYIYSAQTSGELTISTCNQATYSTKIAVYAGDDCNLNDSTIILCQDETPGCNGNTTTVTFSVTEGEAYTIRLGGTGAASGSGTIAVTLEPSCDAGGCPDLTSSGAVDVFDLLELLADWDCMGDPGQCAGDLNCTGEVDVFDLLHLLANWGPCPQQAAGCAGTCGGQSPDGCWCDDGCFDRGDCCIDVCEAGVCCTHIEGCACVPFGCSGFCGGQSPDGCSCDESCFDFDDCCEDVCDECEFKECTAHHVGCEGYCDGQSPDGCWCDVACLFNEDCCEDNCDECGWCEIGYSCEGNCGGTAIGCHCDPLCFIFEDCCNDVCEFCDEMHPQDCGLEPSDCVGFCGEQAASGCWCDEACHWNLDCCPGVCHACPELIVCGGDPPPPPPPPANNTCAGAFEIFAGDTAFSTLNATTDGPMHFMHCVENANPFIFTDIYYIYTATADGDLTISTCNQANYSTKLAVYEGDECALNDATIIICQDETPGCEGGTTMITVPVTVGQAYTIRLGGSGASGGSGTLTLSLD